MFAVPFKQEEEQEIVKSAYIVKMVKFEPSKKVALIKEIKGLIEGMNLVQVRMRFQTLLFEESL